MARDYRGLKHDPFYSTGLWQRLRVQALQRDHYWCTRCKRAAATTVHHVIPREVRPDLELDLDNLECLCTQCHNQMHPEKGAKNYRGERKAPVTGVRVITLK